MPAFSSDRVTHEYTQINPATPERVFPLICPVREADWLPGWEYRLIYSESGFAELGCVFATPNDPASAREAAETTWIITEFDPRAFRVTFVWINPGMIVTEIRIQLLASGDGTTRTRIQYRYTGLSVEGNRMIAGYDRDWFEIKMRNWETTMNHYLLTGKRIS